MLRVFTHTVIFNNSSIDGGSIAARIFAPKIGRYGAISRISSKNISPYGGAFSGLTMICSVAWGFTNAKIKCQFTLGSLPTRKFLCAHIWTRQYASLFLLDLQCHRNGCAVDPGCSYRNQRLHRSFLHQKDATYQWQPENYVRAG